MSQSSWFVSLLLHFLSFFFVVSFFFLTKLWTKQKVAPLWRVSLASFYRPRPYGHDVALPDHDRPSEGETLALEALFPSGVTTALAFPFSGLAVVAEELGVCGSWEDTGKSRNG